MTYITGDTHREFWRVEEFCGDNYTTIDDILVILGDAGINHNSKREDYELKQELARLPVTLLCVHGNHEMRPESLSEYVKDQRFGATVYIEDEFPNILFAIDGEVYNLGGLNCMPIGGAFSVAGSSFGDSQPSEEIKSRVEEALDQRGWEIDVVFSHTCPWKFMPWEQLLDHIKQEEVDSSTEKWLDIIEDRLSYTEWYCGHFHIDEWADKLKFVNIGEFIELTYE